MICRNRFLNENMYCDPSLELSQRYGSNEVSQDMFLWTNYPCYLFLFGALGQEMGLGICCK